MAVPAAALMAEVQHTDIAVHCSFLSSWSLEHSRPRLSLVEWQNSVLTVTGKSRAVSASSLMHFREEHINEFYFLETGLHRTDINYIALDQNMLNSLNH